MPSFAARFDGERREQDMFRKKNPEVLVVGAGPVGQFAALALATEKIPLRIVDAGIWACSHSYALALHPQTVSILENFGLGDRIRDRSYPVTRMAFYEGEERKFVLQLGDSRNPGHNMLVVRQDALESTLEKALNDLGVQVEWRVNVADIVSNFHHATAILHHMQRESRGYVVAHSEWMVHKKEKLDVPVVVGADGYDSEARRSMGIPFDQTGPPQHFAVFEFDSDVDLDHEVRVVFSPEGTSVLWPLPNGRCRWSFEIPTIASRSPRRDKDRLLLDAGMPDHAFLDGSHLRQYLKVRAPWSEGAVDQVHWRMAVRFEKRLAARFGTQRVWLAGDAAHLTGPIGVQSMNAGIGEALDLSVHVGRVTRGGASCQELEGYREKWHAEWSRLSGISGSLTPMPGCDPWVASRATEILPCLPAYGPQLQELAGQMGLAFQEVSHPVEEVPHG
jgi:2-polyprenyl-6-methoxyphenol hydroxylase-like FAD-dependent oxidoreductase